MNFAPDTFESVHRRKKLAAWLATLRGPKKENRAVAFAECAALQNAVLRVFGTAGQTFLAPGVPAYRLGPNG